MRITSTLNFRRQFGNNLGANFDVAQLHPGGKDHLNLGIGLDVTAFHRGSRDRLLCEREGLGGMILIVRGHINTKTDKYVAR